MFVATWKAPINISLFAYSTQY